MIGFQEKPGVKMVKENLQMKCPFCGKGDIEVLFVPSSVRFKKGPYGGSRGGAIRSQEATLVQTDCPTCGKTKQEIEKALRDGVTKEVSKEERLKRLMDSGLPTRIED
jgi:predicted RNA-binding Zn-ribbon protein involved in translation (DUF1610 family)